MNGLQLVEFLRETENKMTHLHKAIDRMSSEPDYEESISVLNEIIKDYQGQIDKAKEALSNVQIGNQQQSGQDQSRQQQGSQQNH